MPGWKEACLPAGGVVDDMCSCCACLPIYSLLPGHGPHHTRMPHPAHTHTHHTPFTHPQLALVDSPQFCSGQRGCCPQWHGRRIVPDPAPAATFTRRTAARAARLPLLGLHRDGVIQIQLTGIGWHCLDTLNAPGVLAHFGSG